MKTEQETQMSQEKKELLVFLMLDEIPLTVKEDIEQLEIDMENYVRSLTEFEAINQLNTLTL